MNGEMDCFHSTIKQSTDNRIGFDGVKAVSEMLKVKKQVDYLYLHRKDNDKGTSEMKQVNYRFIRVIENNIDLEGAKALSDALKTHTTMDKIWLGGESNEC